MDNHIIFWCVAILAFIFITRAIFSIPRILKYNKAQLKLQALIAERLGARKEDIELITDELLQELKHTTSAK